MTLGFTPGNNMPVKIVKAPGYVDTFDATLIAYVRSVDGRPLAVIEYPSALADRFRTPPVLTTWDVVPQECVREPREPDVTPGTYAECGCIAPCPDHTPRAEGARDRAYWTDRYESEDTSDDE